MFSTVFGAGVWRSGRTPKRLFWIETRSAATTRSPDSELLANRFESIPASSTATRMPTTLASAVVPSTRTPNQLLLATNVTALTASIAVAALDSARLLIATAPPFTRKMSCGPPATPLA
jgi:hypothetical protein